MEIAVNDMDVLYNLPQSHLVLNRDSIEKSKILFIDANMSSEIIQKALSIAEKVKYTIIDPISIEKTHKLVYKNILPLLSILRLNSLQLHTLYKEIISYLPSEMTITFSSTSKVGFDNPLNLFVSLNFSSCLCTNVNPSSS